MSWAIFFLWPVYITIVILIYFTFMIIKILNMTKLNVEILKKIVDTVPGDFVLGFTAPDGFDFDFTDNVEIRVSEKRVMLKSL